MPRKRTERPLPYPYFSQLDGLKQELMLHF